MKRGQRTYMYEQRPNVLLGEGDSSLISVNEDKPENLPSSAKDLGITEEWFSDDL